MQVHEVPPCTDSYNMQVVACAVNPSGRFIRLGLTATHPHAKWCVVIDSNYKKEKKMNDVKDVSGCPHYICMRCVEGDGCPQEYPYFNLTGVSECVECPYYSGCKDCTMPVCDRRGEY